MLDHEQLGIPPERFREFMIWWNLTCPFDRWWRLKHGVAFNSKKHRSTSWIDMRLEYEEDRYYRTFEKEQDLREEDLFQYKTSRKWLKPVTEKPMTEQEVIDWFDSIDLNELNKQEGING